MTFRLRVTLLAAAAVAVTALALAALMYLVVRGELVGQVDQTLAEAASSARAFGPRQGDRLGVPRGVLLLSGRPDIFAQVVDASGGVVASDGDPAPDLVTPEARAVAAGQRGALFYDASVGASHLRVHVAPFRPGQALQLARPLDEVDRVLSETGLRVALFALGGVLLAAALGALVAHGALAPVRRLTGLVEEVARTRDLSRRVAAGEPDELGRLATSFNAMLTALEASLRSQRQLVADASHELRTPLTSLRTNLELLTRGHPTAEAERRQVLVDLVAQMERLSTLVADLIDLARDDAAELSSEDVRLDEVAAEVIDEMRQRYRHVRFDLRARPTTVRGVRPRLVRAVTNLLDNAGKWSPEGGAVEVRVADGEISVRDHGPGVAPEDAPRVFDRFWRAASARHLPGSGLGLSIVKDVAEAHGGSVVLEQASGGGTRFRLRLRGSGASPS